MRTVPPQNWVLRVGPWVPCPTCGPEPFRAQQVGDSGRRKLQRAGGAQIEFLIPELRRESSCSPQPVAFRGSLRDTEKLGFQVVPLLGVFLVSLVF